MATHKIERQDGRLSWAAAFAVIAVLAIVACRDSAVSDTMRPEAATLARRRITAHNLSPENSA